MNAVTRILGRLAIVAAVAALVGVGTIAPAGAERVEPYGNSFQRACYALQQHGDRLIAEYRNATPERREEIIRELRANGTTWRQIGCHAVWGNISTFEVPTIVNDPIVDLGTINEAEIIDDGSGSETLDVSQPVVSQPVVSQLADDQDQDSNKSNDKKSKKGKKGGKGRRK